MEDYKTPIKGTPFFIEPTLDIYVRDGDYPPYELKAIPFSIEGAEGEFHVQISYDGISVAAFFGSENWGTPIGTPIVIDGTKYAMSFRCPPVSLSDFDLSASADTMGGFHLTNLDVRAKTLGILFGETVPDDTPLYVTTRDKYLPAVVAYVREFAASNPTFSEGFRQAVATLEIARLREDQNEAWLEMLRRAEKIKGYMKMVPEEVEKLSPEPAWTLSCEETAKTVIGFKAEPARMQGVGIANLEIHSSVVGSLVIAELLDGTYEVHSFDDE